MDHDTNRQPAWLNDHARDVYSQGGEDGIIAKVLEVIGKTDRWCVEFGAWDGVHLSNTRNLILDYDYNAVMIEASKEKYDKLRDNYKAYPGVTAKHALVGFSDSDNLDTLLGDTEIPDDFDFLTIDVDGNDYHIWKAMTRYRPKVVCIEFNPTITSGVYFVQEPKPELRHGSSPRALVELGQKKGYELVCVTKVNLLFVRSEFFGLFEITDNTLDTLRLNEHFVTHIFSGYDGKIFLDGYKRVPWGRLGINTPTTTPIPEPRG